MTDKALLPIEQRQVVFYDDRITAVLIRQDNEDHVYVPIRPICALLGIDWRSQYRRINADPVLSRHVAGVVITTTPDPVTGGGGPQLTNCLHLDYLNGWLFSINAARAKEEVRARLIQYQEECYKVLAEAFRERRLTADPVLDELLRSDSAAVQAYKMLQAMVKLARNQILIEAELGQHAERLAAHDQRLEEIETTLGDPGKHVTPDQAMQISQAVKLVALELGKRSKKNEYGAVYGQFYREFGITSYKQLPAARFDRAMAWLTAWYRRVTGASATGEAPW